MGWTVRGSNSGESEIFCIRPEWRWGPPNLLYNGYRLSFPGVKRPWRGVNHPPPTSAEVKDRVELYVYSPSGPSWPVPGRTSPLPLLYKILFFLRFSTSLVWLLRNHNRMSVGQIAITVRQQDVNVSKDVMSFRFWRVSCFGD
jgi:hypothetical protein